MQHSKLTAAIAAALCFVPLTSTFAQSTNELFAPTIISGGFEDGKNLTAGPIPGAGYEVIGGHAVTEGDMVLGRVDGAGNVIGVSNRGLGQTRLIDRWDNGIIPYQFNSGISDLERSLAEQAIAHWTSRTSISMIELTDENRASYANYITFEPSNGCASFVGMRGGDQQLWISASCGVGSIIHEIGHAVGLFHEHTRSDRDNFISVQSENIIPGKEFNFDVLTANVTLLGDYDYGSIMHYGERFFSNNGENTITVLDGVSEIGQRNALSQRDIDSVNELYTTDLSLVVNTRDAAVPGQINADINVSNLGELGANSLQLSLQLNDGAQWLATSSNPGWECIPTGTVLDCSRDFLVASATSVFTVAAQTNNTASLMVELSARTLETDYTNNGFNATVSAPLNTVPTDAEVGSPVSTTTTTLAETAPTVGALNQTAATQTDSTSAAVQTNFTEQGVQQPVQQSNQPIQIAVAAEQNGIDLGAPAAALPEETNVPTIAAATPSATNIQGPTSSSSGGGALSPLGAIGLFLLTFVASVRRSKVIN